MSAQDRDDTGQYTEKVRDQDILKVFDYDASPEDPYLTVQEVTDGLAEHFDIRVTAEAVRVRLNRMVDNDQMARRKFGPSVAYRALVAPELSEEIKAELEAQEAELEAGETVPHDDLWEELDG